MYGDRAAFQAYHTARGRTIDAGWTNDMQDAALLVASEWIDGIYGTSFVGYKTGGFDQTDEWPRTGAYTNTFPSKVFDTNEIPDRVKNATYEAAFVHLTTPGCLETNYTPGKYKSVQIEGALSVEYKDVDVSDLQIQIAAIDRIIWPLLTCEGQESSMSGRVSR